MKRIKYFILTCTVVLASACTLELQQDPNAVQLNNLDPNLTLNSVQTALPGLFQSFSTWGMQMTRLQNSGGSVYNNVFSPQTFDGVWSTSYATLLSDADALTKTADAANLTIHAGISRVLSAYTLVMLVDFFGDVPYSEALQGSSNFNPKADSQTELYNRALALLDQAIVNFNTTSAPIPTSPPFIDFYYGGNTTRWKRFANSVKLKIFLNRRLVDAAGSTAGINAVLASPDGVISAQADNFVFRYGTNTADPDNRHPRFTANYLTGAGNYMSNHLIWMMLYGYDAQQNTTAGVTIGDPRLRFYFFRQVNANSANPNEIRCVTEATLPAHYPFSTGTAIIPGKGGLPPGISTNPGHPAWLRTYCYPSGIGYWGRDHVDNQGIPPDNLLRTTWGPYPSGGRFDANNPVGISGGAGLGQRGAGFQPIMMRSYVQFMLAEAAAFLGTTGTARTYFENGMRTSFTDVRDWSTNGTFGVGPASPTEANISTFYPAANYTTDVNAYVTLALAAYDAQTSNVGRMNFIAREYWISLFCNGIEAFNLYRRTGLPSGMQPTIVANPGPFPRTFWYPANFANLNNTAAQRADLTGRVFWDTNTANLDF